MTKAVFRPGELALSGIKISLDPPFSSNSIKPVKDEFPELEELDEAMPAFEGPTADDLRREAEAFKAQWAAEKAAMLNSANSEAEIIVTGAKKTAEETIEKTQAELDERKEAAKKEAEAIINAADEKARQFELDSAAKVEESSKAAAAKGFESGRAEGYEAGMAEVKRLIARTQLIMERIQDKRIAIIEQTEQEIVDLALLISRKVVKVISETQRQVVLENIKEALTKIKTKGKVIVKVNLADLETATEHLADFISMVENSGSIEILEDSSVDAGGCYVETDFGDIDARIAVQFAELESKILELSPLKRKPSSYPSNSSN
ncbi:MAG: flagellar assembly protein FliH [Spirochaetaceae bacterium]|jgi:flagellar assembly protein FliH|nr:flagellar assembly protein FliH [Spirochaetaceae bacterium]